MAPTDDPGWRHYPETILEVFLEPVVAIDLRLPIPREASATLKASKLGRTFSVITACNPRGRTVDDAENARRTAELRAELDRRGIIWVAADGVSIDGTHRERGVAAVMPSEEAHELALRYEQSALFRFDGEAFWLIGVLVAAPPTSLPLEASAPRSN